MLKRRSPKKEMKVEVAEWTDPLAKLNELYCMETVRAKLSRMQKELSVAKRDGDKIPDVGHFVFSGAPGTGKTTVARVLADIFYGLGVKPSSKIVETSGLSLTGEYVGHTKKAVDKQLKEAKGGVLFIDEAYTLGEGQFGKEACDSLVAAMTSQEFGDVTVVIAGYTDQIDEMLDRNSGLKSRFTQMIEFPSWKKEDCVSFYEHLARKEAFELEKGVELLISAGCSSLLSLNGWGNGRDVTQLWKASKALRAERVFGTADGGKVITKMDAKGAVHEMLKRREVSEGAEKENTHQSVPNAQPEKFKSSYDKSVNENKIPTQYHFLKEQGVEAHATLNTAGQDEASKMGPMQVQVMQEALMIQEEAVQEEAVQEEAVQEEAVQGEEMEEAFVAKSEFESQVTSGDSNDDDDGDDEEGDTRDEGVPDEVWESLLLAKKMERQRIDDARQAGLEHERFLQWQKMKEEEARLKHEEELKLLRLITIAEKQERLRRKAIEDEQKRKDAADLERRRREQENQRLIEEQKRNAEVQRRLQEISPCPMGYSWFHCGGGWRCEGGSHFVSDEELKSRYTSHRQA
eukprot:GHVN01071129.1.p1 GENE.GHVN01071129.1~~GHVN01071129.1.p1  ORF type:complete len:638 (+),score=127.86 GHVN01071129.1:193-1914(+)